MTTTWRSSGSLWKSWPPDALPWSEKTIILLQGRGPCQRDVSAVIGCIEQYCSQAGPAASWLVSSVQGTLWCELQTQQRWQRRGCWGLSSVKSTAIPYMDSSFSQQTWVMHICQWWEPKYPIKSILLQTLQMLLRQLTLLLLETGCTGPASSTTTFLPDDASRYDNRPRLAAGVTSGSVHSRWTNPYRCDRLDVSWLLFGFCFLFHLLMFRAHFGFSVLVTTCHWVAVLCTADKAF